MFMPAKPQKYLSAALAASGDKPRVIFAAEEHPHRLHHAFQLDMIKAVDALDESPTLIGLEMCWRQHQPALDAFVYGDEERGGGDVELLAKRVYWDRVWGYPIDLYADILGYARDNKLRLCGLNVPYPIVRAVSRAGLEGLPQDVRNAMPPLDVDIGDVEHKRRFAEAIGGGLEVDGETLIPPAGDGVHGSMSVEACQRMYEAQALWDDYMASSIAGYVSAEPKEGAGVNGKSSTGEERMVVLAGSGHIRGRVGMPDRFTRRSKLPTFTMVPVSVPKVRAAVAEKPLLKGEADWVLFGRPAAAYAEADLSFASRRELSRESIFL